MPADLNFMVTRGTGPVRRFRVSFRILAGASVFLFVFVLASVYAINGYVDHVFRMRTQSLQLSRVEQELKEARRALYRSEQRNAVLESHLDRMRSEAKGVDEPGEVADRPAEGAGVSAAVRAEASDTAASSFKADIQDLRTHRAEGKLSFSFKVVNRGTDEQPLRGYVHVIAADRASVPPQLWTYPKTALRDGLPINYKLGHLFVIRHFREIQGECFLNPQDRIPTSLKILVYDAMGHLICEREFPLVSA